MQHTAGRCHDSTARESNPETTRSLSTPTVLVFSYGISHEKTEYISLFGLYSSALRNVSERQSFGFKFKQLYYSKLRLKLDEFVH